MKPEDQEPVYSIGVVSKLLKVCQATLRIWEKKGLIKPARLGKNRLYSRSDLDNLERIKDLMQKRGLNIEGVKRLLRTATCWEIKRCEPKKREGCSVYLRQSRIK